MGFVTEQYPIVKSPPVRLTISSSARRRLKKRMDPSKDALMLLWATDAVHDSPHWLANACRRSDLPQETYQTGVVAYVDGVSLIIPQRQYLGQLDGKRLSFRRGAWELQ